MGAVKAAQRSPRRSSCNYGRTYAYRAESALDPELRVAPRVHCTFIVAHIFIYYMYTARGLHTAWPRVSYAPASAN